MTAVLSSMLPGVFPRAHKRPKDCRGQSIGDGPHLPDVSEPSDTSSAGHAKLIVIICADRQWDAWPPCVQRGRRFEAYMSF